MTLIVIGTLMLIGWTIVVLIPLMIYVYHQCVIQTEKLNLIKLKIDKRLGEAYLMSMFSDNEYIEIDVSDLKEKYIKTCMNGSNYRLEGGKLYVKKSDRYCD